MQNPNVGSFQSYLSGGLWKRRRMKKLKPCPSSRLGCPVLPAHPATFPGQLRSRCEESPPSQDGETTATGMSNGTKSAYKPPLGRRERPATPGRTRAADPWGLASDPGRQGGRAAPRRCCCVAPSLASAGEGSEEQEGSRGADPRNTQN